MLRTAPTLPAPEEEHRRKRMRKGTRSCWECKRRKIRCISSTENVSVCAGCLSRGTNCVSQEFPEDHDQSGQPQFGERLGRVELLLQKLLDKVAAYETVTPPATPESMGNDVLTPYSSNGLNANENHPVLSLFDNVVIGRRDTTGPHDPERSIATPGSWTGTKGATKAVCRPPSKMERLRNTLAAQLPCQHDAEVILSASNCWLLIQELAQTREDAPSVTLDLAEVAKQHPTIIGRTLLYIGVCMQQLPTSFDTARFKSISSLEASMERCLSTATLVTADDELVSTLEGIECLLLQGLYHINAGNLRRAWLTFRRALNVGQLMGLHKGYTQTSKGPDTLSINPDAGAIWTKIVKADRYLALLLGMPCGSADDDENLQHASLDPDNEEIFSIKLCKIMGHIIERNNTEYTHAFAATQGIDESLDHLAKEMPQSWWAIPTITTSEKSAETAQQFHRLMSQIWYFQTEAFLHLPFMLRAATERRYEYSKVSCLRASRMLLDRYLALRKPLGLAFCCKIFDFGAFTSTVTLILGLLEQSHGVESSAVRQQKEDDRILMQRVITCMAEFALTGDVVAVQSIEVIKTLLAANNTTGTSHNLRLTIPYFGTISIVRTPAAQNGNNSEVQFIQQHPTAHAEDINMQNWHSLPFAPSLTTNAPVVSFTSSQWNGPLPVPPIEDWGLKESDNLFFDSLLNSDIEGNWIV